MKEIVMVLVQWAGSHPQFAGLLVAAIAFTESLAFVGILVPGAVMMLGAGALVGVGAMGFWSTFAWAVGGAVAGDGVSYWLGHHYQERLSQLRFLRQRAELLTRGEAFFNQHGGKSILLARFVGPVRPVVPVVAGMLGMPPWRFYLYNILSALAWAPAHLLPGMAFGASLALAGQVAGRLALGIGLLVAFVWVAVWGIRATHRWLQPHAHDWAMSAWRWGRHHRRFAWLVGDLMDPARPVSRPLLLWFALLIAASWLFFGVLEDVVTLEHAGGSFHNLVQHLRTPLGDRIMTLLTESGDAAVAIAMTFAVFAWLLWRRAWRDGLYWLAAVGFGVLAVAGFKAALQIPRPVDIYAGISAYSFPSGHTTLSTVIYGFLAVLSASSLPARWRWLPYALAAVLVGGIGFSRLYLGAHWLADVAAGIGLGTAWVAVLAIARARRRGNDDRIRGLPGLALAVFCGAVAWHVHASFDSDLSRYAVHVPEQRMDATYWWEGGWRRLPAYRLDLAGERVQPLNIQWAGDPKTLGRILRAAGWRQPLALTSSTALHWLLPRPALAELPVTPQLHDGRYEALVLIHDSHSGGQLVLRLWPTHLRLQRNTNRVWVGTVARLRIERLPLISFSRTAGGYDAALRQLQPAFRSLRFKIVHRPPHVDEEGGHWGGDTLIAAESR